MADALALLALDLPSEALNALVLHAQVEGEIILCQQMSAETAVACRSSSCLKKIL